MTATAIPGILYYVMCQKYSTTNTILISKGDASNTSLTITFPDNFPTFV